MTDEEFFATFPLRQARVRNPDLVQHKDQQRSVRYLDECELEFRSLGGHDRNRRRIIVWRVPPGNPYYDPRRPQLVKIPMLAFADETIEDRDDVILPIIEQIMQDARQRQA